MILFILNIIREVMENRKKPCSYCMDGKCNSPACKKVPIVAKCKFKEKCGNPFCIGKGHNDNESSHCFVCDDGVTKEFYGECLETLKTFRADWNKGKRKLQKWQYQKYNRLLEVLDQFRQMLPEICKMNPGKHPGFILRYWLIAEFSYGNGRCKTQKWTGKPCTKPSCIFCRPVCKVKGECSFDQRFFLYCSSFEKQVSLHELWARKCLGNNGFEERYAPLVKRTVVPIQRCWRNYLLRKREREIAKMRKQRELDRIIACQKRKSKERKKDAERRANHDYPFGFIEEPNGLYIPCYPHIPIYYPNRVVWYCQKSGIGYFSENGFGYSSENDLPFGY